VSHIKRSGSNIEGSDFNKEHEKEGERVQVYTCTRIKVQITSSLHHWNISLILLFLDTFCYLSRNQRNQFIILYLRPATFSTDDIKNLCIDMGNCWGSTPVTNHNSPSATKPSTPSNYTIKTILSNLPFFPKDLLVNLVWFIC
jgi:hypothetical protein